jgi:mRNA interferase YafQ
MLTPVQSTQFKKDVKKARKRGKDLDKLKTLLSLLIHQTPLPEAYQDHPLRGNWEGYRDAHIEPDWLLLYPIMLTLILTDTLFPYEKSGLWILG